MEQGRIYLKISMTFPTEKAGDVSQSSAPSSGVVEALKAVGSIPRGDADPVRVCLAALVVAASISVSWKPERAIGS